MNTLTLPKKTFPIWIWGPVSVVMLLMLAFSLAWISNGFESLDGWASFLAFLILGGLLLLGAWLALKVESAPGWLAGLLVGAALLRLAAGAVWSLALPYGGYNSAAELKGYVMSDAYERDQAAWDLAKVNPDTLFKAFQGYRKVDQYGGLLFLSALLYRLFGGAHHQPLQMVAITASFSALAVLLAWAFARRAWGEQAAIFAAWVLALYPEAVLLGSSQMREAFTITLTIAAFYGLLRYHQDHSRASLAWLLGALAVSLPFSPPGTALLVGMLAIAAFGMEASFLSAKAFRSRWFWIILAAGIVLLMTGLWISLRQFGPANVDNPLALLSWWVRKSAEWQAHLTRSASGWVQKIYRTTPEWSHAPLLLAYGLVQPFLPAALGDVSGALIWRVIQIWRSLGWAVMLALLAYATLRAYSKNGNGLARSLSVVIWLSILIASFRGGGDLWDNPRYRVPFAALNAALVGWGIAEQRRSHDPWLRRAVIGVLCVLAWFLPWYLKRYVYLPWPVTDLFKTLGAGLATAALYMLWDWTRTSGPALQDTHLRR